MIRLRKAVFPVADFGTAHLPATKASPKEMLAVVDKPLIQLAVEEAAAAGIEQMIFVTGRYQRAIEDHFDKAYELEDVLASRGEHASLERLRGALPPRVSYLHVRQPAMRGLVDAVLCARALLEDEPFAVILADELIASATPVLKQMAGEFERAGASIVAVQDVSRGQSNHGYVVADSTGGRPAQPVARVARRPSRLGIVGRLILTSPALQHIELAASRAAGPMSLSQALEGLVDREPLVAFEFEGTRYDCSSKLGYLKAVIAYALRHAELGSEMRAYLASLVDAQPLLPVEMPLASRKEHLPVIVARAPAAHAALPRPPV